MDKIVYKGKVFEGVICNFSAEHVVTEPLTIQVEMYINDVNEINKINCTYDVSNCTDDTVYAVIKCTKKETLIPGSYIDNEEIVGIYNTLDHAKREAEKLFAPVTKLNDNVLEIGFGSIRPDTKVIIRKMNVQG